MAYTLKDNDDDDDDDDDDENKQNNRGVLFLQRENLELRIDYTSLIEIWLQSLKKNLISSNMTCTARADMC
jgi:hypothetical protein